MVAGGERDGGGEVAAGAVAGDRDRGGVELAGVAEHILGHRPAVVVRRGEGVLGCAAVVNADDASAHIADEAPGVLVVRVEVSDDPATAVEEHNHRQISAGCVVVHPDPNRSLRALDFGFLHRGHWRDLVRLRIRQGSLSVLFARLLRVAAKKRGQVECVELVEQLL